MRVAEAPGPDLAGVIQKLARTSVLVVGDAMLDRFVFGTATRLSPEAPVPILAVDREICLPGGAGNVVRNLTSLGAAAALVSVVGDDQAGSDLTGLIGGQANVEPWLLVEGSRCTTVKTRFMADGQQLLRADSEVTTPINAKLAERMLRIVGDSMTATNVTVLSDYGKGVLAGGVPSRLIQAARDTGRPVVVDTRGDDLDRFAGADVVVLTTRALEAATGMAVTAEAHITCAADWLRIAHGFGSVVVNRRADGFYVVDSTGAVRVPPAAGEPFNFTGASDTAVAAVAASLASGLKLVEAVRVASLAVSVCASQPGVPVASAADLLAVLTPQGQALRKIMAPAAAAAQIAHWRRAGLRTGVVVVDASDPALHELALMRRACDRLTLCVAGGENADLAHVAGRPEVDLVCAFAAPARRDTLIALRPDVLLARESGEALQALVESWGGSLVVS